MRSDSIPTCISLSRCSARAATGRIKQSHSAGHLIALNDTRVEMKTLSPIGYITYNPVSHSIVLFKKQLDTAVNFTQLAYS